MRTYPFRKLAASAALSAALVFSVAGCAAPADQHGSRDGAQSGETTQSAQTSAQDAEDGRTPDVELLASLMDEEEAAKLLEGAQSNEGRYWIATHPEALDCDGETVQGKLLRLAADEDEAVEYVRHFGEKYPAEAVDEAATSVSDPSPTPERKVPRLYQWDERWGYTVYSSTAFGLTGCGPTAFAMAYQGVTGKSDFTPYDAGLLAQETGHMAQFEGTGPEFFFDASARKGITCESISVDAASARRALDKGAVLIANVGNRYFSRFSGHYLVLTGIDSNGKLTVNDPYSAVHSTQAWDIDFILDETMGLYAFWVG